jgi:hypothetical protein
VTREESPSPPQVITPKEKEKKKFYFILANWQRLKTKLR